MKGMLFALLLKCIVSQRCSFKDFSVECKHSLALEPWGLFLCLYYLFFYSNPINGLKDSFIMQLFGHNWNTIALQKNRKYVKTLAYNMLTCPHPSTYLGNSILAPTLHPEIIRRISGSLKLDGAHLHISVPGWSSFTYISTRTDVIYIYQYQDGAHLHSLVPGHIISFTYISTRAELIYTHQYQDRAHLHTSVPGRTSFTYFSTRTELISIHLS